MFRQARSAAALTLVVLLASCPAPTPRAPAPSPPPGVERGGVLRVLLAADVDALDPHVAASPSSWFFARALHRGLLAFPAVPYPAGARPVPDLAASWRLGAAGTRYTFLLREGVAFGAPASRAIVAADVRASLRRLIRAGRGVARFLRVVRAVRAPDDRTVVIRLAHRAPDLPSILAHPQAAILPAGTPRPGRIAPASIVGAGPYRIEAYAPERSIELARNQAWGSDPVRGAYVDRIEATLGVPAGEAQRSVVAGDADLVLDPGPPDLVQPRPPARARVVRATNGCVRYLFLNGDVAPFGRAGARRAVALAVARAPVARVTGAAPATGLLPPTVLGHLKAPALPESVERARAALLKAGLRGGFRATLVVATSPRDRAEAAAVKRALARAGIRLEVRTTSPATLYTSRYERRDARTPMGIATWCADWPGLAGRNVLGSVAAGPSYAHPRGPATARAIARAGRALAPAAAWAGADAVAGHAAYVVALAYPVDRVVVARRVGGPLGLPMWPRGDPASLWLRAG